jgi:hypothetical protein
MKPELNVSSISTREKAAKPRENNIPKRTLDEKRKYVA